MHYQTLHNHTIFSDGELSPAQILEKAHKEHIDCVAFTDHDAVCDEETFHNLRKTQSNVSYVWGVEISSAGLKDYAEDIGEPHIVGLFIDPLYSRLKEHCVKAQAARHKRAKMLLENVNGIGISITMDDINEFAQGESIGRPHVARAMLKHPKCTSVVEDYAKKLRKDAQTNTDAKVRLERFLRSDQWQKIFELFLGNDAYVRGVYVPYLYKIDLDGTVSLIRNAGGIALLAHWTYNKKQISIELLEKLLKENRLDGVETVYGFLASHDEKVRREFDDDRAQLKTLISKHHKSPGGGGDFHKGIDFESMNLPHNKSLSEETVGLVQKIIPHVYKESVQLSHIVI